MGAELSLLAPTAQTIAISAYIDDFLNDTQYSKPLSTSRFLKTIKCLDSEGSVVVKLLVKPVGPGFEDKFNLGTYVRDLQLLKEKLSDVPNVLPFTSVVESSRAGYLIRPFIRFNLYDRISIRPFLESIEKKWIVYQLLMALSKCHQIGVCHGDLKSENIMTTSWNWIMICDFASFKPVYLPEDNPSQFSFYFDTSQRHTCYLAPERFLSNDQDLSSLKNDTGAQLTTEMDIFGLGCVIAELYFEGSPLFTLPQLFKYKKNQYTPNLDAIEDPNIRKMIHSMISLDPKERLSAKEYLIQYRKSIFPDHFYTFLHPYIRKLSTTSAEELNKITTQDRFPQCDMRINRILNDFDKISLYLGFNNIYGIVDSPEDHDVVDDDCCIPLRLDLAGMKRNHIPKSTSKIINSTNNNLNSCSSLIMLSMVLHSVRNTTHSSFRIQACDLILAFSEQIHDEAKLDRCLPYLIYMLDDPSEDVQCAALKAMTQLLSMVDAITSVNVYAFPEYIIPKLQSFLKRSYSLSTTATPSPNSSSSAFPSSSPQNNHSYVRSVFAACLPFLAQTSQSFYEMARLLKKHVELTSVAQIDPETENGIFNANSVFDVSFSNVIDEFESMTIQILTDPDPYVRTSLLKNITILCSFFGREKTNDVILSHLITYLNDKDPQIRLMFVNSIVGISIFVGVISLEQYILPLLVQSLNDADELVVISVVKVFTELIKLGFVRKSYVWDLVKLTAKLLLHPNEWIRNAVLALIISIADKLSFADLYCMLYPLIRPFFQYEVADFNWITLYTCLHKPLSRQVYNLAKSWSLKSDPTLFWQIVDTNRSVNSLGSTGLSFMVKKASLASNSDSTSSPSSSMYRFSNKGADDTTVVSNSEVPLSQFDLKQITKLKGVGLGDKELWKVATLRSYIYKVARHSNRVAATSNSSSGDDTSDLQRNNVLPRTVFLDVMHSVAAESALLVPTIHPHENLHLTGGFKSPYSNSLNDAGTNGNSRQSSERDTSPASNNNILPITFENGGKPSPSMFTRDGSPTADIKSVPSRMSVPDESLEHDSINYNNLTTKVKYSYTGNNTYILKFLGSMKFDPNLDDYSEFGPILKNAILTGSDQLVMSAEEQQQQQQRKPGRNEKQSQSQNFVAASRGVLVAKLLEHKSCVNAVAISPDHKYFITGDEEGNLKFWDSLRLETNVTCSSILSISFNSAIKSISFMKDRDCFAISTKDGNIQIFKVNTGNKSGNSLSLGNISITLIRQYRVPADDQYAMKLEFSISPEKPYLIFITPTSKIVVLDIRTMRVVYLLQNKVSHGFTTDFVIDSKQSWILVSTSKGILDLWDLTFELHLKAVKFNKKSYPIKRIELLPSSYVLNRRKDKFVAVIGGSGESDITVWDVSKLQCREAYCSSSANSTLETYSVSDVNEDDFETSLQSLRFDDDLMIHDNSCTALCVCESSHLQKRHLYILGATVNAKVIQWNVDKPENSRIIVGSNASDLTVFSSTQLNSNIMFINERITTDSQVNGGASNKSFRSRSSIVSHEQQQEMRNHHDVITAIAMITVPYNMVVSADRSGVISVFR